MIFVSGQIPGDSSGKLVEGNIGDKTAQCCKNIIAILEEAGSSIERVVKVFGHLLTSSVFFPC